MTNGRPIEFEVRNLVGDTALGGTGSVLPYNFTLDRGEIGVVFGGKESSSLLRLLIGLGKVTSGDVRLAGDTIFASKDSDEETLNRRQQIGFAFRDKGLISNLTIRDNVDLPAKYHGYYKRDGLKPGSLAEKALTELEVPASLWTERPNRINWEVRKKVLLARAIVLNPSVLFLDDPSAMAASPFIKFLIRWVIGQKAGGRAVLIGTDDYPFGMAVGDWCLHPQTGKKTTDYAGFIEPCWIESASILKNRIVASCS